MINTRMFVLVVFATCVHSHGTAGVSLSCRRKLMKLEITSVRYARAQSTSYLHTCTHLVHIPNAVIAVVS